MNIFSSDRPPLALIAGPTASGKSGLALRLARRIPSTIVNADSAQAYRDLRVLSARPSEAEEKEIPHLLYGDRDGADPGSAAGWAAQAKAAIARTQEAGRLAILVGGTGLYLRTLMEGIAPVPDIDPTIRIAVRALPVEEAHAALAREDPDAARRIRPTDRLRTARALEVIRSTGRTLAEWQREKVGGLKSEVELHPLILLPPRDWLYRRCDLRFAEMFGEAGIEEVRALLARNLPEDAPILRAIGVPEIAAWLRGEMDRETALERGRAATRRYAKRQYTWFRHQPPPEWPRFTEPLEAGNVDRALAAIPVG